MTRFLTSALFLGLLFSSCSSEEEFVRHDGLEVIIKREHQHSKYCGHYRHGSRWYYMPQHKHAVNCGHEEIEGVWILES